MNLFDSTISCGVSQLYNIYSARPVDVVKWLQTRLSGCTLVFSDNMYAERGHGGFALAAYIRKHRIGRLSDNVEARNPNSGSHIGTWVWAVSREDIAKALKPKRRAARKKSRSSKGR